MQLIDTLNDNAIVEVQVGGPDLGGWKCRCGVRNADRRLSCFACHKTRPSTPESRKASAKRDRRDGAFVRDENDKNPPFGL